MTTNNLGIMVCVLLTIGLVRADILDCPYGTTPTINGVLAPGEWSDAVCLLDQSMGSYMYVKHDGSNVYFAFDCVAVCHIEHFFDTEHNGGNTPQTDDRYYAYGPGLEWECHGDGSGWVEVTPSGWTVVCGYDGYEWRGELAFTFAELGIISGQTDTLGMMLIEGFNWGGNDFMNPSTWSDFYSSSNWTTGIEETKNAAADVDHYSLAISPNPFRNEVSIGIQSTISQGTNLGITDNNRSKLVVYDASGSLVRNLPLPAVRFSSLSTITWDGTDDTGHQVSSGVYIVHLEINNCRKVAKVVLSR